jgi:hypothetical protein
MTRRDRIESRIALAMLPVGATMTLVSVVAFIVVVLLALATIAHRPEAAAPLLIWCVAALGVAAFNTVKSIETMSAFDWRSIIPVGVSSVLITLAYPGWWL